MKMSCKLPHEAITLAALRPALDRYRLAPLSSESSCLDKQPTLVLLGLAVVASKCPPRVIFTYRIVFHRSFGANFLMGIYLNGFEWASGRPSYKTVGHNVGPNAINV